jgi:hypothetical protein
MMEDIIRWAAFAGGWLLVAGPLFQGAVELRNENFDRDAIAAATEGVERPARPSRWWWLLPPVMWIMRRFRETRHERDVMLRLDPEQRVRYLGFMNKATGWFTVAGGALLIAAKETWELTEHLHWPIAIFWVLMVVMAIAAILNMAIRMLWSEGMRRLPFTPPAAPPDDRTEPTPPD